MQVTDCDTAFIFCSYPIIRTDSKVNGITARSTRVHCQILDFKNLNKQKQGISLFMRRHQSLAIGWVCLIPLSHKWYQLLTFLLFDPFGERVLRRPSFSGLISFPDSDTQPMDLLKNILKLMFWFFSWLCYVNRKTEFEEVAKIVWMW